MQCPNIVSPNGTIREREALPDWVEASVWTDRMWTALHRSVEGKKWYSLIDKVWTPGNLRSAWERVRSNRGCAGIDQVSIQRYARVADRHLERLRRALKNGWYRPQPGLRKYIAKSGSGEKRPLGIPAVEDRIVQAAVKQVLEPIFELTFSPHSYGFRPGRTAHEALGELTRGMESGRCWVVDVDLKSYFDTIDHVRLLDQVRAHVSDGRLLRLLEQMLQSGVMEGGQLANTDSGTPQGGVISPLLANIYLTPLDRLIERSGHTLVRYADDFVVLCRSRSQAEAMLQLLSDWTQSVGLQLHPTKTRLVDMSIPGNGFDFLGYHFYRTIRGPLSWWPRDKSIAKCQDALRRCTPRNSGRSIKEIIARVNAILRGWFHYFRYSRNSWSFIPLEQWLRMRLRSILRRRRRRKGRGRGRDHQRWPNSYFSEAGLFSPCAAWYSFCLSADVANH